MPRSNKITIRTGTGVPSASAFVTSEPAWDSSAKKLYIKAADGTMVEVGGGSSSIIVAASVSAFPATGSESALYLAEDTSRIYQWESPVYVEVGGSGGGVIHASTHATGGTDEITPASIGAAAASHTHAYSSLTGVPSSFAPSAHAASHAAGGSDALSLSASQITGGVINAARLGSGTANSTTFLRGDGAWQAPVASFATSASFPATGITGTYYLDSDRGRLFQWTGSQYAEMGPVSTYPVAHAHSWSDITSGTLPDSRLSANVPILPAFLLTTSVPTTAVDSGSRVGITALTLVSGQVQYTFFTPAITVTVSQITMGCHSTAASGLTLARMGLFTYDETNATLVARTANDTALFAATRTLYTRNFDTAGGFPASYTLQAGVRYGVGVICVGTTPPQIAALGSLAEWAALTPRIASVRTSQTDLATVVATGGQTQGPIARLS